MRLPQSPSLRHHENTNAHLPSTSKSLGSTLQILHPTPALTASIRYLLRSFIKAISSVASPAASYSHSLSSIRSLQTHKMQFMKIALAAAGFAASVKATQSDGMPSKPILIHYLPLTPLRQGCHHHEDREAARSHSRRRG